MSQPATSRKSGAGRQHPRPEAQPQRAALGLLHLDASASIDRGDLPIAVVRPAITMPESMPGLKDQPIAIF